jgi:hypothetical protein
LTLNLPLSSNVKRGGVVFEVSDFVSVSVAETAKVSSQTPLLVRDVHLRSSSRIENNLGWQETLVAIVVSGSGSSDHFHPCESLIGLL